MNKTLTLITIAFFISTASAQIADQDVLGMKLGHAIDRPIAPCKRSPGFFYMPSSDDWCLAEDRPTSSRLARKGIVFLVAPDSGLFKPPSWYSRSKAGIIFHLGENGVVDSFTLDVHPTDQNRAIETVSNKFGQPKSLENVATKTRAGLDVQFKRATWSTGIVDISTSCTAINACYVRFSSAEYADQQVKKLQEQRSSDKL